MRTYTTDEINKAIKNAPPPIRDFTVSPTLMAIFDGLRKKHSLNLREVLIVSQITTHCLLGLEKETAFETNLHQELPEISHDASLELVSDINTRVFKEARRRLEENILEPSAYSDIHEPDPNFAEYNRINNLDEDGPEKAEILAKEQAEAEADKKAFEEKVRLTEAETATNARATDVALGYNPSDWPENDSGDAPITAKSSYQEELDAIDKEFAEKPPVTIQTTEPATIAPATGPEPKNPALKRTEEKLKAATLTSVDGVRGPSIVQSKLTAPSTAAVSVTPENPLTEKTVAAPKPVAPTPKRVDGVDPYRERPE